MRRSSILISIIFLTICFATVSTTLLIKGNTSIGVNENDFNVYFSNAKVNGEETLSIIKSEKELNFFTILKSKNDTYIVDYDVTNGSKNYDVALQMTCVGESDYLTINNLFDTSTNLEASQTRSGSLTIKLRKGIIGDSLEVSVSCVLNVTGIERTELGTDIPLEPVEVLPSKWLYTDLDDSGDISIGDEITLALNNNEKFNVISKNENTVTMLAKYNLDSQYRQSEIVNYVSLADYNGWEYTPGPKDIDIQQFKGNARTYINGYLEYLQEQTVDPSLTGTLITLAQLKTLECTINDNYSYSSGLTCANSQYKEWLINNQFWWTRSARSGNAISVWNVASNSPLYCNSYDDVNGIRPVITVSVEALNIL